MQRKFLKIKYALSIVCTLLCVSLTGCSKVGKNIPSESPSSYMPDIDIRPVYPSNPQAQQIMNDMMQYPEEISHLVHKALTLCMKESEVEYIGKIPVHLPVREHHTLVNLPVLHAADYSQDTRFRAGLEQRYGLHMYDLAGYGYSPEHVSAYVLAFEGNHRERIIGTTGQPLGSESSCMVQVSRYIFGDPATLFFYQPGGGYAGAGYISYTRSDKGYESLERELVACIDKRAGVNFRRDILEGYAYVYPGSRDIPDSSIAMVEMSCRQDMKWEQKISSLLDAYLTAFLENPKYEREREAYGQAHEYALAHYEENSAALEQHRWVRARNAGD